MIERLKIFLRQSREEWKHVSWPTRREAIYLTALVIGFSLFLAAFLGLFDLVFYSLLQRLLGLG